MTDCWMSVLVSTAERDELQASLANWQDGTLYRPALTRYRARHIELDWTGFEVHLDDEAWPAKHEEQPALRRIELTVEHDALDFLVPATRVA